MKQNQKVYQGSLINKYITLSKVICEIYQKNKNLQTTEIIRQTTSKTQLSIQSKF